MTQARGAFDQNEKLDTITMIGKLFTLALLTLASPALSQLCRCSKILTQTSLSQSARH